MAGRLIVFEGQDGAGKSTQMDLLEARLRQAGRAYVRTREPGGVPIAEKIRALLLDPENNAMDPRCEAYLYAAARAQHVAQVIQPALAQGKVVLCDRFIHSSLAYQGCARALGEEAVRRLNDLALQGVWPDVVFYFALPVAEGIRRISARGAAPDRLEGEDEAFHARVQRGYEALAAQDARVVCIDASLPPETMAAHILQSLQARTPEIF
nr:dTMP kinase [Maliibacterium massiliense]